MGEVGRGFKPKKEEPVIPPGSDPNNPEKPQAGPDEGDPPEGDPPEGDPPEGDLPDETLIGRSRSKIEIKKMTAARNRVAFKVIDKKSTDLESQGVEQLSSLVLELVSNITDPVLKMERITPEDVKEIKFDSRGKTRLQRKMKGILQGGWSLGLKHARDEINKAKGESFSIDFERLDEEAAAFFDTKSFQISGKLTEDMRTIISNILLNGIKASMSTREVIDQIYEAFAAQGFYYSGGCGISNARGSPIEGGGNCSVKHRS